MAEVNADTLNVPKAEYNGDSTGTQTPLTDTDLSTPPNEKASLSDVENANEASDVVQTRSVTGFKVCEFLRFSAFQPRFCGFCTLCMSSY